MQATTTITESPRLANIFGPLDAVQRRRLHEVLHDPVRYWDRDHGLLLRPTLTLWQAILRVDPTFPRTGPVTDRHGRVVEDWPRYPDSVLIGRAIRYAIG